MNDLIYIGITVLFSSSAASTSGAAKNSKPAFPHPMETCLTALIALALLAYLLVAMLRPEKF